MSKEAELRKKEQAVILHLKKAVRAVELAKQFGVSRSTIYRWITRYSEEGKAGLRKKSSKRQKERNNVYPIADKLSAVLSYKNGEGSQQKICKKYGIRSKTQLQNWIKVYNVHGDLNFVKQSGGGSYMKQGRNTTHEERIEIVKDCIASRKNYGEIALKYQISYQQVRKWTLRFEELGEAGLQDRRGQRKKDQAPRTEMEQMQIENEQLKHKLYLLKVENALLKKLDEVERRECYRK